jgi:hypothetical protein
LPFGFSNVYFQTADVKLKRLEISLLVFSRLLVILNHIYTTIKLNQEFLLLIILKTIFYLMFDFLENIILQSNYFPSLLTSINLYYFSKLRYHLYSLPFNFVLFCLVYLKLIREMLLIFSLQ